MKRTPPDPKAQAKRAALNALRRAKRQAARGGVELSAWEGEFLGSVEDRLRTYGRAFGDPEKGAGGSHHTFDKRLGVKRVGRPVFPRQFG